MLVQCNQNHKLESKQNGRKVILLGKVIKIVDVAETYIAQKHTAVKDQLMNEQTININFFYN